MRHLPMPQRSDAKAAVHDELGAAQYGAKWLEANRQAAMRDAAAAKAYQEQTAAAQADLARRQGMYTQSGPINENYLYGTPMPNPQAYQPGGVIAPGPAMPPPGPQPVASDENAKRLRGMLDAAEGRLLKYEDTFGALPRGTGNTPYWAQQTAERSGAPQSLDIEQGPRPMAARHPLATQAAAIPAAAWEYDPQHAVQANIKNGQPPDGAFGRMQKTGPMAQDLLRVPATRGAVMQGPDGMLQVDGGQVAMSGLGMIGDLARQNAEQEERLRQLERMGIVGRRAAQGSAPKNIDDAAMWWDSGI